MAFFVFEVCLGLGTKLLPDSKGDGVMFALGLGSTVLTDARVG